MTYYVGNMPVGDDELMHYGTKGMRWGQRRFQNRDGSLTAAGRLRYGWGRAKSGARRAYGRAVSSSKSYWGSSKKRKKVGRTAAKVAGGIAGAAAIGYLGKRYGKNAVKAARTFMKRGKTAGSTLTKFGVPNRLRLPGAQASRARRGFNFAGATMKGTAAKVSDAFRSSGSKIKRSAQTARNIVRNKRIQPNTLSINNGFRNRVNRAVDTVGRKTKRTRETAGYYSAKVTNGVKNQASRFTRRTGKTGGAPKLNDRFQKFRKKAHRAGKRGSGSYTKPISSAGRNRRSTRVGATSAYYGYGVSDKELRRARFAGRATGYAIRGGMTYGTYKNAKRAGRSERNARIGALATGVGGLGGWAAYRIGDRVINGKRSYPARKKRSKKRQK